MATILATLGKTSAASATAQLPARRKKLAEGRSAARPWSRSCRTTMLITATSLSHLSLLFLRRRNHVTGPLERRQRLTYRWSAAASNAHPRGQLDARFRLRVFIIHYRTKTPPSARLFNQAPATADMVNALRNGRVRASTCKRASWAHDIKPAAI
jgi:hypothetical protein